MTKHTTSEDALRRALANKNIQEVARIAGVSAKTCYRIRNGETSCTLATADRILSAIREIASRTPRRTRLKAGLRALEESK